MEMHKNVQFQTHIRKEETENYTLDTTLGD